MKLIYIYHSGFVLQGKKFAAVIDYYKAGNPENEKLISELLMHYTGRLYVLVSHAHPDHFNPVILQWEKQRPDLHYIFSEDIKLSADSLPKHCIFIKKLETWKDEMLRVKAFGSTDIGISFLIEGEGKRIFHAGDLNNWHWAEESTAEEAQECENHFLQELESLAGEVKQVDLALFPVDPRLGKDYMRGACQFIGRIHPCWFAPMHFWEKYGKANAFREYAEKRGCRFIAWTHSGQCVEF